MVNLRLAGRYRRKKGLAPGTLLSNKKLEQKAAKIRFFDYSADHVDEGEWSPEDLSLPGAHRKLWINVDGSHDITAIKAIGTRFSIHPLVLEDIMNVDQRAKIEDFDDEYIFVVAKMLYFDESKSQLKSEQVSFVLGANYLISFQEVEGDVFDSVRKRLRENQSGIRKNGASYLLYALLDSLVDHYLTLIESIGERIETLEKEAFSIQTGDLMPQIGRYRTEILYLRKSLYPFKDVVPALERRQSSLVSSIDLAYYRDVEDHLSQVFESIEAYREMLNFTSEVYMSRLSFKMNDVMKVLTLFASIFIPLTFVAGIYGMNFEHMPELDHPYAYFVCLGAMAVIGLGLLFYFKRKNWL